MYFDKFFKIVSKDYSNINKKHEFGNSIFINMCKMRDMTIEHLQLLVQNGADVNDCDVTGNSPLIILCKHDYPDLYQIAYLILNGANVHHKNNKGHNALMALCMHKTQQLIKIAYLIKKGMDVNEKDNDGATALLYLCKNENINLVSVIYLIKCGANINCFDKNGMTPLMFLCKKNKKDIFYFDFFVQHVADINKVDINGNSALLHLCSSGNYYDYLISIIKLFIEHGADIHIKNNMNRNAVSILCEGCCSNKSEQVMYLLQNGADASQKDIFDMTPLMYFICNYISSQSSVSCTEKLIIALGENINDKNKDGENAMTLICKKAYMSPNDRIMIAKKLIDHGAKKSDVSGYIRTEIMRTDPKYLTEFKMLPTEEMCLISYEDINENEKYIMCESVGKHVFKYEHFIKFQNQNKCLCCGKEFLNFCVYINKM